MDNRGFTKLGRVDSDGRHHWLAAFILTPVINAGDILFLAGKIVIARQHPHYGFEFESLIGE